VKPIEKKKSKLLLTKNIKKNKNKKR